MDIRGAGCGSSNIEETYPVNLSFYFVNSNRIQCDIDVFRSPIATLVKAKILARQMQYGSDWKRFWNHFWFKCKCVRNTCLCAEAVQLPADIYCKLANEDWEIIQEWIVPCKE